jgi:predicted nucleic acid-binding Zn ribbon protein
MPLQGGIRFCTGCGTPVEEDDTRDAPASRQAAASGPARDCPKCGRANPPGGRFCRQCATKLGDRPPNGRAPFDWRKWASAFAGVAAVLIAGGVVAVVLTSGKSGGDAASATTHSSADAGVGTNGQSVSTTPPPATTPSLPPAPQASRQAIVDVLREYEAAYADADLAGLASVLALGVERHGLSAGGCTTVAGKPAVLAAYKSQFVANGPLPYRLVGLTPGGVVLQGTVARVETSYSIASANNSGPISFTLEDRGGSWRVIAVDATCRPRS